jgi:hypothetical protein
VETCRSLVENEVSECIGISKATPGETIFLGFSHVYMSSKSSNTHHPIRPIRVDSRSYMVSLNLGYDGIEYIGRLWFADVSDQTMVVQDHGAIPGASIEETVRKASSLTDAELEHRCHRALSEKRRFTRLRAATDKMIAQIKYLNRVVVNLQNGMIDRDGGHEEIAQIERQILAIVKTFPIHAGVEGD